MELLGLSKIGFMSVLGSTPAAKACHACARLISPPPVATTLFNDIFCGLKGETRSPARFAKRHKPATIVLLPALECVMHETIAQAQRGKRMLMIQGTASSAGKSTIVAGLCRLAKRAGLRVSPFKPQNMSLNSVVATGGGEMSRAQAWQAFAAGVDPHTDMNPILLKPNSSIGSQVIIQGRVACTLDARSYQQYKPIAMRAALDSFRRIRAASDIVFIECAGSPAEVNLRHADIANMGFAEAVDCPVLLVD